MELPLVFSYLEKPSMLRLLYALGGFTKLL